MTSLNPSVYQPIGSVANPFLRPLVTVLEKIRQTTENHIGSMKNLACGTMSGCSAFLPLLYQATVELSGILHLTMGVFIVSLLLFAWLYRYEIAINAPYTLVSTFLLFMMAIMSSRTSLEEFTPYIPLSISMGLLLTVHVVPKIVLMFQQGANGYLPLHRQEANIPMSTASSVVSVSSVPREDNHGNVDRYFASDSLPFSHMDRRVSYFSNGSSTLGNIPDLDSDLERGHNLESLPSSQ